MSRIRRLSPLFVSLCCVGAAAAVTGTVFAADSQPTSAGSMSAMHEHAATTATTQPKTAKHVGRNKRLAVPGVKAVAAELKLEPKELRAKLRGGATLHELAAAAGVSDAAVTTTIKDAAAKRLDERIPKLLTRHFDQGSKA